VSSIRSIAALSQADAPMDPPLPLTF
jgi:hypothetical protein